MKRFVVCLLFVAVTMLGCAQNHFNIPAESFAEKVRVIGIAPIFIDADSDISYSQKDLLIPLLANLNRKYEPLLMRKLQSTGNFYAVVLLTDEPQNLYSRLVARREKRDDAGIQYNKYFWKNDEVAAYIKKNRLDSVMLIVVNGLTKKNKVYSSNLLTSLETDYNYMMMTAQILGPDGTVLWEYPNFRSRLLTYYPLVNLQYPDFSESEANKTKETVVRFKTIDGIRRTLEEKKKDWMLRETEDPEVYDKLFGEMTSLIKHDSEKQKNEGATGNDKANPASSGVQTQPAVTAPAAAAPSQPAAAKSAVRIPEAPAAAPNEIVPATESTR